MDTAERLFQSIRLQGLDIIREWIAEGYREDLHLDFKRKSSPQLIGLSEDDRRNFSKALSGFANSDGGVIVWGIDAPGSGSGIREMVAIHEPNKFAELLDSMISRLVNPQVDGVENHVILAEAGRGFVVTLIPRSILAPHRAEASGLKHYYKRYGDSFKPVEHYELEYMFGKRLHPRPHLFWDVEVLRTHRKTRNARCQLRIGITNLGRAIARFVCLRIRYDATSSYRISNKYQPDLIHYSQVQKASRSHFLKITARAQPGLVIYPNDSIYFFLFEFSLPMASQSSHKKMPSFHLYYDLFAEDFENLFQQHLSIPGRKILDKTKKKLQDLADDTTTE